jgi:hypothetical protein
LSEVRKVKKLWLNMGMKCWNSTFNGARLKVIIVVVQVGAVKIYVAAVEALRKKERGGSKQHETQGNYSSCTGRSSENLCSSSLFDISMKRTCQVCQHWKQPLFPLEVVEKTIIFQVLDSCCSVQKIWLMTHHCMIRSSCSIKFYTA